MPTDTQLRAQLRAPGGSGLRSALLPRAQPSAGRGKRSTGGGGRSDRSLFPFNFGLRRRQTRVDAERSKNIKHGVTRRGGEGGNPARCWEDQLPGLPAPARPHRTATPHGRTDCTSSACAGRWQPWPCSVPWFGAWLRRPRPSPPRVGAARRFRIVELSGRRGGCEGLPLRSTQAVPWDT